MIYNLNVIELRNKYVNICIYDDLNVILWIFNKLNIILILNVIEIKCFWWIVLKIVYCGWR